MTKVVRKRHMMNMDEFRTFDKYRTMFRILSKGHPIVIVTESYMSPEMMFGNYEKVFMLYVKRELLTIKTLAEATDEDMDGDNTFTM